MPLLDPDAPAVLLRSRAPGREDIDRYPMEEIGRGPLAKMIRVALSDPDDEIWPYAIAVAGQTFAGEAIRELRR